MRGKCVRNELEMRKKCVRNGHLMMSTMPTMPKASDLQQQGVREQRFPDEAERGIRIRESLVAAGKHLDPGRLRERLLGTSKRQITGVITMGTAGICWHARHPK